MYMLLYSHESEEQRLVCMCYYTAMKVRPKGLRVSSMIRHESEVKRLSSICYDTAMKVRSKG